MISYALCTALKIEKLLPRFNFGAPMSRRMEDQFSSTLLDKKEGKIVCPPIMQIGFAPDENVDFVEIAYYALEREGFESPQQLIGSLPIPKQKRLVMPLLDSSMLPQITALSDREILQKAVILGLCTATFFDPNRPVLWTHASLTRRLTIFKTGGIYALD